MQAEQQRIAAEQAEAQRQVALKAEQRAYRSRAS